MPFKSKAQRRWMHWAEAHGKMPKGSSAEWESHTEGPLPEHVKKDELEEMSKTEALEKYHNAPGFPGLGIEPQTQQIQSVETPRQYKIAAKRVAAETAGQRGKDTGQGAAGHQTGYSVAPKLYNHMLGVDSSTHPYGEEGNINHEAFHLAMSQVQNKYGPKARKDLVNHLYFSMPRTTRNQLTHHMAIVGNHQYKQNDHEEKLAFLITYINDGIHRDTYHNTVGHSHEQAMKFHKNMKSAYGQLRMMADTVSPDIFKEQANAQR